MFSDFDKEKKFCPTCGPDWDWDHFKDAESFNTSLGEK